MRPSQECPQSFLQTMEFEMLGRHERHPDPQIRQIGAEVLFRFVRQWREFANRSHLQESAIDVQLKVAVQPAFRILPCADERILEFECDAIKILQDIEIGSQQLSIEKEISIEIHPTLE